MIANQKTITIVILIITMMITITSCNKKPSTLDLRQDYDYVELLDAFNTRSDTTKPITPIQSFKQSFKELYTVEFDTLHCALYNEHLVQKVIYNTDDRQELYNVTNCDVTNNSNGVAALFFDNSFVQDGDSLILVSDMYGITNRLCDSERFYDQPQAAFCSGFLIDNPNLTNTTDYVVTAGHCLDGMDLNEIRVVFGFKYDSPTNVKTKFHRDEVHTIKTILDFDLSQGGDYGLVQLNSTIDKTNAVKIQKFEDRITQDIYVMGYPAGIPLKYADNATVIDSFENYFNSDLDTYGGNSGSPVFDAVNHKVIGILVRGEIDFIPAFQQNCSVSKICQISNCSGEDVNFIDPIIEFIENN